MTKIAAFIAVAALSVSVSSAEAAKKRAPEVRAPAPMHVSSGPKKHFYGKRLRARWSAGCKMSGSC